MSDTENVSAFPVATEAQWRRLIEEALGGKPFTSLISRTFEGLEIAPLYVSLQSETPRAERQNTGRWRIAQRMDHPDPEIASRMARADLEGGANALTLTVSMAPAARGFGVRIGEARDLDAALKGIDLDRIPLRLDAGIEALSLAPLFAELARRRRLTSAPLDVDFGIDPIGHFVHTGTTARPPEHGWRELRASLRGAGFAGHLLLADGRPYHDAGAGEAQELACVIAAGVAYLRMLEAEGVTLEEARAQIAFLLAADVDEHLTLAKYRAFRRLWARVEELCGLSPGPIRLHAETSYRMLTRYDPFLNISRNTIAVFAAAAAGADVITVLPFTLARGLPDDFARRLARNIQSILVEESHLEEVTDPAQGAGTFEALTDQLCDMAWALFQKFEAAGGMISALRGGLPQNEIGQAAAARRAAIAHLSRPITGVTAFPLLAETPVNVLAEAPLAQEEGGEELENFALRARRDAEPFEALRDAVERRFEITGHRPKISLVRLGDQEGAAACAYAAGLFAIVGIEAVEIASVEAWRESGCNIACLFARTSATLSQYRETATSLVRAGAAAIYLVEAEAEGASATMLKFNEVDLTWTKRNALAILRDATAVLVECEKT
ncbi:MAG TPA: methylmalonyl-CoA mutase family protein [Methylocella sp.]|nr:methylmalonyl-CoA mutase family protein [Methylocella sp.]